MRCLETTGQGEDVLGAMGYSAPVSVGHNDGKVSRQQNNGFKVRKLCFQSWV